MNQTDAARAVLIEVIQILGAFKDDIVIIGGWVPDLLYPGKNHIGSLDVDLAVGPGAVSADAYTTILGRLKAQNYSHHTNPTRFNKYVQGAPEPVKIDLISREYFQEGKKSHIQVNELQLNTLRGVDLAFESWEEVTIKGHMPDGSQNTVRARIARPESFILIKAFAMAERQKEKDAYDIAFILKNFEPTLERLAERITPIIQIGLGAEAYRILTEKFEHFNSVGPTWAANIAEENGMERQQAQQSAYQDAQELFGYIERKS